MKGRWMKKAVALGCIAALAVSGLAGCGSKKSAGGKDDFQWWIFTDDSQGRFYSSYEENPTVQFINQQYWDTENGGIGDKETGTKLNFSFITPVTGSEQDNFNTMIGTGEYPEIIDIAVSPDNAETLYENGVLMDITEYVEKYMPNYRSYIEAHPEVKPFVTVEDEEGKSHYYALYGLRAGMAEPWEGSCYRRDWIVKYATPTEYVWDWDSAYVKENGHPQVTPLSKAQSTGNLDGWKKNTVTSFTSSEGADPDNDYTDNVIFPSGTSDPLTISDWEWMFEAFTKAIEARGWTEDSNAYCTTITYAGALQTGDLVSSFGGGNGNIYNKDGTVTNDGTSENFKTYVEAMENWYEKGWLDQAFSTRSDIFYDINSVGVNQGKTGLWCGYSSVLGSALRATCADPEDAKDYYVMGCSLPINDVYGSADQMYQEPDTMFQESNISTATGITTKAEDKDLEALFTFLDWTYSEEGGVTMQIGLSPEQYKSVELDPDLLAENNLSSAYTASTDEQGRRVYTNTVAGSAQLCGALTAKRMATALMPGNTDTTVLDTGNAKVVKESFEKWSAYKNTGSVSDYTKLFNSKETSTYGEFNTQMTDYIAQNLPGVIQGKMSWEDYEKGYKAIDGTEVIKIFQKYLDKAGSTN